MVALCNERFMPKVTNDIKREEKNVAFHMKIDFINTWILLRKIQEPLLTTRSIYLAFLFATCNNLRCIEETTVEILMSSFMRSSH